MQADCLDCSSRALDGPTIFELPDPGGGLNEVLVSLQEGHADARMVGDPVSVHRAYVASRAGIDATSLALGAHGLLPAIETMFSFPGTCHAECRRAIRIHHGTVVVAGD
jgi:hypothetical protein